MACELAPMGGGGETSEARSLATVTAVVPTNQPTSEGIIEIPAVFDLPRSSAPPTEGVSALGSPEPAHPTIDTAGPIREAEVPTLSRTVSTAPGIRLRGHITIMLKSCVLSLWLSFFLSY